MITPDKPFVRQNASSKRKTILTMRAMGDLICNCARGSGSCGENLMRWAFAGDIAMITSVARTSSLLSDLRTTTP
jgi:hypothetical protein